MERYNVLDWAGWALATVGALNWGLKGAADFNLVHALLGRFPIVERAVYVTVGLAGLASLARFFQFMQLPRVEREMISEQMTRVR